MDETDAVVQVVVSRHAMIKTLKSAFFFDQQEKHKANFP